MFTEIKKADKEFREHITVIRSELDNEAEAKRSYPHSGNEGVHKHVNSKCFYTIIDSFEPICRSPANFIVA